MTEPASTPIAAARPLRAVVFDFGDTLFTSPDGTPLLVAAGWTQADAEALIAEAWRESKTPAELGHGRDRSPELHREAWLRLFRRAERRTPGMAARLYEATLPPDTWVPYADTEPVLAELHRRQVPVAVLSNIAHPLRPVFELHGLERYVSTYTLSYEVGREKPDPALFEIACRSLGCAPRETLMVGDSHLADGAATLAGMPVLLLPMVGRAAVRGLASVLDLVAPQDRPRA
ncbi:MAG: HAD-IA family hydrolase [Candidatus Dormiibacterota bacterium]